MADHGPEPFVTDIEAATLGNGAFRTTLWTGTHLQLTLMCLQPEEEIGLEVHHDIDQFLRVEQGAGRVVMGPTRDDLSFKRELGRRRRRPRAGRVVAQRHQHRLEPAAALLGLRPRRARARHGAPHQGRGGRRGAPPLTPGADAGHPAIRASRAAGPLYRGQPSEARMPLKVADGRITAAVFSASGR